MCNSYWHKMRLYLFFNVQKLWAKMSDSVWNDLNLVIVIVHWKVKVLSDILKNTGTNSIGLHWYSLFHPGLITIRASVHFLCDTVLRSLLHVSQRENVVSSRFYYVYRYIYCCVFITLLKVRIAAVENSNIRGLSRKVNVLSQASSNLDHPCRV